MPKQTDRRRLPRYERGRPDALDFTEESTEAAWDEDELPDPGSDEAPDSRDEWAWSRGVCVFHTTQDLPVSVQRVLDQREWLFYPRHGDRDHVHDVYADLAAEVRTSATKSSKTKASLSSEDKATLLLRRERGETLRSIADDLGVSPVTIYRALKKITDQQKKNSTGLTSPTIRV